MDLPGCRSRSPDARASALTDGPAANKILSAKRRSAYFFFGAGGAGTGDEIVSLGSGFLGKSSSRFAA